MESWVTAYLDRIEYQGSFRATPANLADLHQAHMYAVPFEDLDIHQGVPLSLDRLYLRDKIINRRRGGFCYELNYLFGTLLIKFGYSVTFISGRVFSDSGDFGSEFDHMALMVESDGKWLADVGFGGSSFIKPLSLESNTVQVDEAGDYQISRMRSGKYQLSWSPDGSSFKILYSFTLEPQSIDNFQDQCQNKQEDKNSHFVKNKICTMATSTGRKSLLNDLLTIRNHDQKETIDIQNEEMEKELLMDHFNIRY